MSNTITFGPNIAVDANNDGESGAVATFFNTGTSDPQEVFTDKALTAGVFNATADSAGVFPIIYSKDEVDLKVVVKTAGGAAISTTDPAPVHSTGGAASTIPFAPIPNNTADNVQDAIENNSNRERIAPAIFTAGSGTYVPPEGCRSIRVEGVAAGGGAGGVDGVGSDDSMGSGGGGGGYFRLFIESDDLEASYAYAVGAGGAGGVAGDNDGVAGGNTTFNGATNTAQANGGFPGSGHTADGASSFANGGAGGSVAISGFSSEISVPGQRGRERRLFTGVFAFMSRGGDSFFASGAASDSTAGAGMDGVLGSGGSGAHSNNATDRAGGAGGDGMLLITEFY